MGLLGRLIVAGGAAMVIAIAAKPYEGKIRPYVEKMRKVRVEMPRTDVELGPSEGGTQKGRIRSDKKRDNITEGDRSELEAVLNRL